MLYSMSIFIANIKIYIKYKIVALYDLKERWLCLKEYFEKKSIWYETLSAKIPETFLEDALKS